MKGTIKVPTYTERSTIFEELEYDPHISEDNALHSAMSKDTPPCVYSRSVKAVAYEIMCWALSNQDPRVVIIARTHKEEILIKRRLPWSVLTLPARAKAHKNMIFTSAKFYDSHVGLNPDLLVLAYIEDFNIDTRPLTMANDSRIIRLT